MEENLYCEEKFHIVKQITADINADVLKVGHHRSKSSTSESFLKKYCQNMLLFHVVKITHMDTPHLVHSIN